jgi:hypothetical protein
MWVRQLAATFARYLVHAGSPGSDRDTALGTLLSSIVIDNITLEPDTTWSEFTESVPQMMTEPSGLSWEGGIGQGLGPCLLQVSNQRCNINVESDGTELCYGMFSSCTPSFVSRLGAPAIACGASLSHAYGHKAWCIYIYISKH